jgi:hypothetical protein
VGWVNMHRPGFEGQAHGDPAVAAGLPLRLIVLK